MINWHRKTRWTGTAAMLLLVSAEATAQGADTLSIDGPTVIAFYTRPASDSVLDADPDLAAALDNLMAYWADTDPQLTELGITARTHAGRQVTFRVGAEVSTFRAAADSSDVGYLLIRPDGQTRTLYRLHYPEELLAIAREFFLLSPAGHVRAQSVEASLYGLSGRHLRSAGTPASVALVPKPLHGMARLEMP